MKIIDISWPINLGMTEYKDRDTLRVTALKEMSVDNMRLSHIAFCNHTGTHVDAPSHFLSSGKTVDQIDLKNLIGPCRVLDCMHVDEKISAADLVTFEIKAGEIILFKTANSNHEVSDRFDEKFVYLDQSAAAYLAERNIKAVGIDYPGIERNQPGAPTHKALLEKNISIIEGIRLSQVKPGNYFLICLPLLCIGLDAAPARAILIDKLI